MSPRVQCSVSARAVRARAIPIVDVIIAESVQGIVGWGGGGGGGGAVVLLCVELDLLVNQRNKVGDIPSGDKKWFGHVSLLIHKNHVYGEKL